ncbi:MAG: 4Fe-4S dicluster domain-containing protein [Gordonibacter sp.]|uniref:4Fe-4S dicluster domain-containing protein n=1 Tax=Gordonibacter sp. TaxID=1968902 RepID=UPI002FCC71E7
MGQKAFLYDMTKCTGCKCCQVACKDKNDLDIGYFYRKAIDYEGGEFPDVWAATISMACNHCDSPICLASCPQGAIFKEEKYGLVIQDQDSCIGCQTCVEVCPYGAPVYFPGENKSGKCDGCIDWLENGMLPACAGACSTRCLRFDDEEAILAEYQDAEIVNNLSALSSSEETGPNFYIIPKKEMV